MRKLSHLVVGTGRSGTVFLARLLTSVGIFCGHESIFDYKGIEEAKRRLNREVDVMLSFCSVTKFDPNTDTCDSVDWHPDIYNLEADSSYMSAPFLENEILNHTRVIHAVRNPIDVINSYCNSLNYFLNIESQNTEYEKFIYSVFPQLREPMPQYDRAAMYYILWNRLIEKSKPDVFFRIEDHTNLLLDALQIPRRDLSFLGDKINTFKKINKETFDCSKIQNRQIRFDLCCLADEYGYKIRPITLA